MAEFGEQLRKARENSGMTQQSLAEKVYVTRQTVSRWEGGERYPDLVTVKKITKVLGVNADFLLSDDETQRIVERNSIIEKAKVNNITLVLFACIVISYFISAFGVLLRITAAMTTGSIAEAGSIADVYIIGGRVISDIIRISAFTAGFVWVFKGSFSPKRVAMVMMAFFAAVFIENLTAAFNIALENIIVTFSIAALCLLGCISSYFYFSAKHPSRIWYLLNMTVSVLGIVRALYTAATTVIFSSGYVSADTAVKTVLTVCIYILLAYQTYELNVRRDIAKTI